MTRFGLLSTQYFLFLLIECAFVLTLFVSLTHSTAVNSSEVAVYSASYTAKYNDIDIKANYSLEHLGNNLFVEKSEAKSLFGKITEEAEFLLNDTNKIVPQKYLYRRSLLGVSRKEDQIFHWGNNKVTYTKNGDSRLVPLPMSSLDMVTHKVQLRRDLKAGKKVFSYLVMSRGRVKAYDYEVIKSEILMTALGPLNTTKVRRVVSKDKKRETVIWMATDWDYLIVKLVHSEKGESHQLDISNGQVGGKQIATAKAIEEKSL